MSATALDSRWDHEAFARALRLTPQARIADIGFGTGIFTQDALENGIPYSALAHQEMRRRARNFWWNIRIFGVLRRAENTTRGPQRGLHYRSPGGHWLTVNVPTGVRKDTQPGGWVALIWNERLPKALPFSRSTKTSSEAWDDYGGPPRTHDRCIREFFARGRLS